jgi:hypothetical protein
MVCKSSRPNALDPPRATQRPRGAFASYSSAREQRDAYYPGTFLSWYLCYADTYCPGTYYPGTSLSWYLLSGHLIVLVPVIRAPYCPGTYYPDTYYIWIPTVQI